MLLVAHQARRHVMFGRVGGIDSIDVSIDAANGANG